LPAALDRGGLRDAINMLVSRVELPVTVEITSARLPPALERTAYLIVAEALANTLKHAHADSAQVTAIVRDGVLHIEVRDDGVGGARTGASSGLLGLQDRAAALDGELRVQSPPGGGTVIAAALPIVSGQ
jgi:signal transduction histidine kinase